MPIQSIRLQNFRCFLDSGDIPIRPLTIVFGRNNAGKSSILDSLFLLRQTLDQPEYEDGLNMRGPLYAAGGFADIVHKHRSSQTITMEFGIAGARGFEAERVGPLAHRRHSGKLTFEFASQEPRPPRLILFRLESKDSPTIEIRRGRGRGGPRELYIGGKAIHGDRTFRVSGFVPNILWYEVSSRHQLYQRAFLVSRALIHEFRRTLLNLRAVGAFRAAPERRYDYQALPQAVDLSGQNAVYALIDDAMRRGKRRGSLISSLNHWLRDVGHVYLLPLRRISPSARLYELRVKDVQSGRWANFADVGFGIGQALPVLVEGLRTPVGGTFIVQEPEIHLHLDAQLAMADYLVELARSGRTVIAETHSEAILLRIRRSIVQGGKSARSDRSLRPDQLSVVHVTSNKSGASQATPLKTNQLGQIQDWPHGFMEEVTKERLELLEALAKRRGQRHYA